MKKCNHIRGSFNIPNKCISLLLTSTLCSVHIEHLEQTLSKKKKELSDLSDFKANLDQLSECIILSTVD